MPLHWRVDSREKLFVAVAEGNVEFEDVGRVLDALVPSGVLGYRKLFDGMQGETRMTPFELLTLGARIRTLHGVGVPLGPVALVLPERSRPPLMRLLGILAASRRPLRIFSDLEGAHRWLGLQADPAHQSVMAVQPERPQKSRSFEGSRMNQNGSDLGRGLKGPRLKQGRQQRAIGKR